LLLGDLEASLELLGHDADGQEPGPRQPDAIPNRLVSDEATQSMESAPPARFGLAACGGCACTDCCCCGGWLWALDRRAGDAVRLGAGAGEERRRAGAGGKRELCC
jgi:hypothetical protein